MMGHIDARWITGVEWGSGSSVEDPTNGVKFQLPDPLTVLASVGLDAEFLTQNKGQCSYLQDQQSKYIDNVAQYAGGIMYSTDQGSLNITCKEHAIADNGSLDCGLPSWGGNNIGKYGYGPLIAFPPARVDTDLPSKLTYVSNGVSKLSITAQVSDEAGTHITTGTGNQAPLRASISVKTLMMPPYDSPAPILQGQTQAEADESGVMRIDDMILSAIPGDYALAVTLPDYPQVPSVMTNVTVRGCVAGEVQPTATLCVMCSRTTYSFNSNATTCNAPCSTNAVCYGSSTLIPASQFWHSAVDSEAVLACPNPSACQGDRNEMLACQDPYNVTGSVNAQLQASPYDCDLSKAVLSTKPNSYMVKQCSKGYYGPLCSLCIRNDITQYGRTSSLSCQPCRNKSTIIIAYIASILLVLIFLVCLTHITLHENEKSAAGEPNAGRISEIIKGLTLWMQYMTLLGGINIPFPNTVHWIFSAVSFAFATVTSGSLSVDCLLNVHAMNPALQRVLWHSAIPLFSLMLLALVQLAWLQLSRANWPLGYWVPDMSKPCFTSWHLRLSLPLGVPLLVLVCVGIPLLPYLLLAPYKTQLQTPAVKIRIGFIYRSYKPDFWYWDSVVLVQTLALATAQVFATALNSYFQLTVMLMILMVGGVALPHFQPFKSSQSQRVQVLGLFTVTATATGSLYFLDSGKVASHAGLNAVGILLLLLNVAYLLLVALLLAVAAGEFAKAHLGKRCSKLITTAENIKHAMYAWLSKPFARQYPHRELALAAQNSVDAAFADEAQL
ncbi:TPA: hypothetical protein ACH3X2_005382 [Trebouxia sp. C0005]